MPLLTLVFEFLVFHMLVDKLLYEPRYEITREDSEILPVYYSTDSYKPLSMERLFMIDQMLK